jgi:hypothetical protein
MEVTSSLFTLSGLQKYACPLTITELIKTGRGYGEYCEIIGKWSLLDN